MYEAFVSQIVGTIGLAFHMPRNLAIGNSAGSTFSSGKLDHNMFFRYCETERIAIVRDVIQRIYAEWWKRAAGQQANTRTGALSSVNTDMARIAMRLGMNPETDAPEMRVDWDRFNPGESLKEAQAAKLRIETGVSDVATEAAAIGHDWEAVARQRQREIELFEELGLPAASAEPATPGTNTDDEQEEDDDAQQAA
jgi:capsid protein